MYVSRVMYRVSNYLCNVNKNGEKKRIPEESWFKSVLTSRREPSIRHRSSNFYAVYQPNVHQFPDGIAHISPTNNYNQKIKMLYCWHSYLPDPYSKAGVRLQYMYITLQTETITGHYYNYTLG